MALAKMKLVTVIGAMNALDEATTALGRTGVFQPDETAEFFSDNESMIPVNSANEYSPLLEKLRDLMNGSGIRARIVDAPEYDDMSLNDARKIIDSADEELGEMIGRRDQLQFHSSAR